MKIGDKIFLNGSDCLFIFISTEMKNYFGALKIKECATYYLNKHLLLINQIWIRCVIIIIFVRYDLRCSTAYYSAVFHFLAL